LDGSLRVLYICYLSLDDPLVHSQVVAYLEGLARCGHTVHLLTFDTELSSRRREGLAEDLLRRRIRWHSLRYHKHPSLPATVYDTLIGAAVALRVMRRHRLTTIHARNHVPAATALIVQWLTGCRMIFDLRGLMAEEYVDAGRWRRGQLAYRLTNWIQRVAIRNAHGIVVLTEAVRHYLFDHQPPGVPLEVIPCCADVAADDLRRGATRDVRAELGLGDRPLMAYVGKFTGWYMEREMVDFYRCARDVRPGLMFLVLTQSDRGVIEAEFRRAGVPPSDYVITRVKASEVERYLAPALFGICFVRPTLSKISSSPTKIAEYLGAGMPVVSTAIGDLPDLFVGDELGVLIEEFSPQAYVTAASLVDGLATTASAPARCRAVARERLSLEAVGIPRYDELYRAVASDKDTRGHRRRLRVKRTISAARSA
jgi:glycosyltransferase involved in cell wall biosynthesis